MAIGVLNLCFFMRFSTPIATFWDKYHSFPLDYGAIMWYCNLMFGLSSLSIRYATFHLCITFV